jgi:hypothetical protein
VPDLGAMLGAILADFDDLTRAAGAVPAPAGETAGTPKHKPQTV